MKTQSSSRDHEQSASIALDGAAPGSWRDYVAERPPAAGVYEWRVPSRAVSGLIVRSLAHFRRRGAGWTDVLSPAFDHWDGYSVHVPAGTQWREPPPDTTLEWHEQRLVCAEGIGFEPCPFCARIPTLKGVTGGSSGGVVITSDAHTINRWRLACCQWAKSPEYADPRVLAEDRRKLLAQARGTPSSQTLAAGDSSRDAK